MNAWQEHHPGGPRAESPANLSSVHLEILGWRVIERRKQTGLWQNQDSDLLSLVRVEGALGLPPLGDEDAVRRHCEMIAESMESRLVEVAVLDHVDGRAVMFVCRGFENWALVFTGILMVPTPGGSWMWEMVAKGRSVTGDIRCLCDDCLCPAHPLARVKGELRRLLTVKLDA